MKEFRVAAQFVLAGWTYRAGEEFDLVELEARGINDELLAHAKRRGLLESRADVLGAAHAAPMGADLSSDSDTPLFAPPALAPDEG